MIIGITGKSGSGKSTLANKMATLLNYEHVDFDKVVHQAIDANIEYTIKTYGNTILTADGKIDRRVLGDVVFSSRNNDKEYSYFIYRESLKLIDFSKSMVFDHILLPHLPEVWSQCTVKILVFASGETRRERIIKRDAISSDYYLKRESASIEYDPFDFDITVNNNRLPIGNILC